VYPPCKFGQKLSEEAKIFQEQKKEKPIIHVRFVTRGTNPQTIIESCSDMDQTLEDPELNARAEWKLEVVTDNRMDIAEHAPHVNQIVVPDSFVTKNNTKFKARALD